MRQLGIPETRQNFIDMAYTDDNMPKEWTAEHELALPEHLQQPLPRRRPDAK